MKRTTLRLMAFTAIMALGATSSYLAHAEDEDITVNLTTVKTITLTTGNTMDFGTYLILAGDDGDATITMTPDNAVAAVADGNTTNPGAITFITGTQQAGTLTINSPASTTVDVTGSVSADFSDPNLTLTEPTCNDTAAAAGTDISAGALTLTVVAGVDSTLSCGGLITIGTVDPIDTAPHVATITVSVNF